MRKKDAIVSIAEPLDFPLKNTDFLFTASPNYRLRASYRLTTSMMHNARCLLNTGGGVSSIHSALIASTDFGCIERGKFPTLCTASKQPLFLNGLLQIDLHLGNHHSRILFGIAPLHAVDIVLCREFINCFFRGILSSERKEVLWGSKPFAIKKRSQSPKVGHTLQHLLDGQVTSALSQFLDDTTYEVVRAARQVMLDPCTQHHVLPNKNPYRFFTNEPQDLLISRHTTLTALDVAKISSGQPSCILVSNLSNRQVWLSKRKILAHAAEPPNVTHAVDHKASARYTVTNRALYRYRRRRL